MPLVKEVRRDVECWAYRDASAPFGFDMSYVCNGEFGHYFQIPHKAERGWVTLSSASKRPGPEWIKLKLVRTSETFSWSWKLKVEPRPGSASRRWRSMSVYPSFREDIREIGARPAGGVWCWIKFEYET